MRVVACPDGKCVPTVQRHRFFTWTWVFADLDDSWTARLVAGRSTVEEELETRAQIAVPAGCYRFSPAVSLGLAVTANNCEHFPRPGAPASIL